MIRKIAVFGSTGLLGKPVTVELVRAGFQVRSLVRNTNKTNLPPGLEVVHGDLKNFSDVQRTLEGCNSVYISLSIKQSEKPSDWHAERDGLQAILTASHRAGIQHIVFISSLAQFYQGMNGFYWWAFDIKQNAVKLIKESGIPYTIFYPSTFMENFVVNYRQGNNLLVAGKSEHKQFFIAAEDYAKQVTRMFTLNNQVSKEYVIQGPEGFTTEEACEVFKAHYRHQKLSIIKAPYGIIKFMGKFFQTLNYGAHIIEALNKYPEKFEAENTWEELGKPKITLRDYAASL